MRVSLSFEKTATRCSRCASGLERNVEFLIVVDGHVGHADVLCVRCMRGGLKADIPMELLVTGPAPRKKALKKAKKTSLRQELEIAEEFGGRTQPGSGNQAGAKGDVRKKGELRIEAKYTMAESYSLKLDDLDKIAGEATFGELPVMVIDFVSQGTRKLRGRYAVLHADHFKELHAASQDRGPKRSA